MMAQFIPKAGELEGVERELRFHPSTVSEPRVLTREQVATFNREGYPMPLRIFDDGEIAAIRRYFDALLARTIAEGGDGYSIRTAHLKCGPVWDLLTDARIVGRVWDLLGEDVIGWG